MSANKKEMQVKQLEIPDFYGTPHPVKTPINF